MKIVGSNGLYGRYTLPFCLETQKQLGYDSIVFYHFPSHLWLDYVRCSGLSEVKTALQRCGITVEMFCAGNYGYSLYAAEDDLRGKNSLQYYKRCIDTAKELDCKLVCLRPTGGLLDHNIADEYIQLRDNLKKICGHAAQQGVTICIQTVLADEGKQLHTMEELSRLLTDVPDACAVLDTVPMSNAGETLTQWISTLGSRIRHICFQDGRWGGCRIWGQGVFPSDRYVTELLHSGYDGTVSLIGRTDFYCDDPRVADKANAERICAVLREAHR